MILTSRNLRPVTLNSTLRPHSGLPARSDGKRHWLLLLSRLPSVVRRGPAGGPGALGPWGPGALAWYGMKPGPSRVRSTTTHLALRRRADANPKCPEPGAALLELAKGAFDLRWTSCGGQELNIPTAAKGLHLDCRLLPRIQYNMKCDAKESCCADAGYLGKVLWHGGQHWKVFQFRLVPAKDIL